MSQNPKSFAMKTPISKTLKNHFLHVYEGFWSKNLNPIGLPLPARVLFPKFIK